MRDTLKLLSISKAQELQRFRPKQIKEKIFGKAITENVFIIDQQWIGRPLDVEVGDIVLTDKKFNFEGDCLGLVEENLTGKIYCSLRPGMGRLVCGESGWASFVRVSRREYVGLNTYRHLEDPDYD